MRNIIVSFPQEAFSTLHSLFESLVTPQTLLFLSGGKTPIPFYSSLSQTQTFHPEKVYMVDERYGGKFHEESNEAMMRDTGLLASLEEKKIPFVPILHHLALSLEETGKSYNEQVKDAMKTSSKKVALIGIGPDGHIAGIAPNRGDFLSPLFSLSDDVLVSSFTDFNGQFGRRITLTFSALSQMDHLIVLVLGENKQYALKRMREGGREEELPATFLMRPEVSEKVILITDQND